MNNSPWSTFTGSDLSAMSAYEVVALLRNGEVSSNELVDLSAQRITAVEPHVNAMPTICPELAAAAGQRWSQAPVVK